MDKNTNSLNWFEIPALDIKRAQKFYESIFAMKMDPMEMMEMKMRRKKEMEEKRKRMKLATDGTTELKMRKEGGEAKTPPQVGPRNNQ